MIDAATGRVQPQRTRISTGDRSDDRGQPTAMVPWVHPPVELDDNRFAFADGTGLVRLLDLDTDRVKWTYAVEGESSLAGESPQVRRWGEAILVAVRRNYGVELDRIESFDGSSVWRGPVFIDAAQVNLGSTDADFSQVYVPAEGKIVAHSLEDGKRLWEA